MARCYELLRGSDEDVHVPDYEFHNEGNPVSVRFLGVWDTVGALGIPDELEFTNLILDRKDRWEFHDTRLGDNVRTARHAMALDEMRSSFTVSRWETRSINGNGRDVREVWFPGVHGDVGGGYQDSSLSDNALEWMIGEAEKVGLRFRGGVTDQTQW